MMIDDLEFWLSEIVADFVCIDGFLFIDRNGDGIDALKEKIYQYDNVKEAQVWINIVLIDAFMDEISGGSDGWRSRQKSVEDLLSIYKKAWTYQICYKFPDSEFIIEFIYDDRDVGLRLIQS